MSIHFSPSVKDRDKKKNVACKELGITLITIPYWWDGKLSSLAATIQHIRPDIPLLDVHHVLSPIPTESPTKKRTLCT